MLQREFKNKGKGMFKRIHAWVKWQQFREYRRIFDYRATNLAVKLTLSGSLTPCRPV